jgi:hypothetical protein
VNTEDFLRAKGYQLINGQWFAPSRVAQTSINQPNPKHESVGKGQGKTADPVRRTVRITSYRRVLVDRDAVWVKYAVDSLRYSGIIFDDTTEWLEIETKQVKVCESRHERTEIEII